MATIGELETVKVKSLTYPGSFFNVLKFDKPKSRKEEILWAKNLFDSIGIIKQSIRKLATYPITELKFTGDEKNFYKTLFEDVLKSKLLCQNVGMDYFTYGMSLISPILPFDRYLKCERCKEKSLYDSVKKLSFSGYVFKGKCPKCKKSVKFKIVDTPVKRLDRVTVKRWYPGDIDVIVNELSGDYRVIYTIPPKIADKITKGDIWFMETVQEPFIAAVKDGSKKVELNNKMLYLMSIPEPSTEDGSIVGSPFVSGAWTDAFILKVLKKAQETMAADRFVSYRVLFPDQKSENPLRMMNLGNFRSNVKTMLERFYTDPNEMGISPIPIGQLHIGGDGKIYNPQPELEGHKRDLLADLGVPYEFVYGGLSYSGSSVSLRMLENLMLNYRGALEGMLEFIAKVVGSAFKKEKLGSVDFVQFKMADDAQRKQLIGNLNLQQKVSDSTVLAEYGMDAKDERKEMTAEAMAKLELQKTLAKTQAIVSGETEKITAMYRTITNSIANQMSEEQSTPDTVRSGYTTSSPDAMAKAIMSLPEHERSAKLRELNASDPQLHQQILEKIYPSVDMTPMPEQKPPMRGPGKGGE